jgi:hypothetical protein
LSFEVGAARRAAPNTYSGSAGLCEPPAATRGPDEGGAPRPRNMFVPSYRPIQADGADAVEALEVRPVRGFAAARRASNEAAQPIGRPLGGETRDAENRAVDACVGKGRLPG